MLKVLSAVLAIQVISSVLIKINGTQEKHCFSKIAPLGDFINVAFMITGDSENEKTKAMLYNPKNEIIYSEHNEEGEFEHEITENGVYKLCFYPEPNREHYLSLEFYTKMEKGHFINMAKDENLHQMKDEVTRVATMLETLEENVRFIMDRRNMHYDIIKDITDGVQSITFIKISIIVIISFLQIIMIAKFFKNSKKIGLNPFYDSGL